MGRTRKWLGVAQSDRHIEGKSCPTNLIVFYSDMSGCVEKGRTECVVHLDFSKASHVDSLAKPVKYRLHVFMMKWVEN